MSLSTKFHRELTCQFKAFLISPCLILTARIKPVRACCCCLLKQLILMRSDTLDELDPGWLGLRFE
jgi:hypothetical protein